MTIIRVILISIFTLHLSSLLHAVEPLTVEVEELVKKSPNDSHLIFYGADWDISGERLKMFLKQAKVIELLAKSKAKIYYADCTEEKSAGRQDMYRRGVHATPVAMGYWKNNGVVAFSRIDLTSEETFLKNLSTILNLTKETPKKMQNKAQ